MANWADILKVKSVVCNSALSLTVAEQDVPNLSITYTPTVDESVLVIATLDCDAVGCTNTDVLIGKLYVNAAAQTPVTVQNAFNTSLRETISQTWVVALTGGVAYTIKMKANNTGHAQGKVWDNQSTLTILVGLGAL